MAVRILIADDHQIVRNGLRALIESRQGYDVIGEADNGREAIRLAKSLDPDIVIIDVTMPELNGIDATRRLLSHAPDLKVICLSMHSDRNFVAGMLHAGAKAYICKESAFDELWTAIDSVQRGGTHLGEGVTDVVIEGYRDLIESDNSQTESPLSSREREVLQLLAEGSKTSAIAEALHVSVKTIETHRRHIMLKLDLHSVAELTKYAIRTGLTSA